MNQELRPEDGARPPTEAVFSFVNKNRSGTRGLADVQFAPSTNLEVIAKRGSGQPIGPRTELYCHESRDMPGVQREPPGRRPAKSVATFAAKRLRYRTLRCGSACENDGASRRHSRQTGSAQRSATRPPSRRQGRMNRHFSAPAPKMLWLSYCTYRATWQSFPNDGSCWLFTRGPRPGASWSAARNMCPFALPND